MVKKDLYFFFKFLQLRNLALRKDLTPPLTIAYNNKLSFREVLPWLPSRRNYTRLEPVLCIFNFYDNTT